MISLNNDIMIHIMTGNDGKGRVGECGKPENRAHTAQKTANTLDTGNARNPSGRALQARWRPFGAHETKRHPHGEHGNPLSSHWETREFRNLADSLSKISIL